MKLHHHVAFSATTAFLLLMIFKSWYLTIACLLSGICIDLDHVIDYYREQGFNLDIKKFFMICENGQFDKVILMFHGWEWILLCALVGWSSGGNYIMTGIIIGFGHHMVLDAIYNKSGIKAYSLLWRWSKDFHFDTIFPNIIPIKYKFRNSLRQSGI